ncbi:MAG TPA: ADP-ribosylglycohydrolase family protein [Spirochaetia bacterium]|nr:ADP-ribosylglycohydrolase family protein [Spirochaetia bacterium]
MRERAEAMVLASFAADSHALGAHWIYDIEEIASRYGRVERLLPPPPDSFHAGRSKGSFTHYGDQALLLLRHLASHKTFDRDAFSDEWLAFMQSYGGYRDHATAETIANLTSDRPSDEAGSRSTDLSAAGRIAPLVYLYRDEREELVRLAHLHTQITHNSAPVAGSAIFLAHVLWNILNGNTPGSAIASVLNASTQPEVAALVQAGLDSVKQDTHEAALSFGQNCSVASALPLSIHLIAKYEGSLKDALVENVAVGGDSAARGMVVGMVLGAFHGHDAIPDEWIEEMVAYKEISTLLEDLEAILQRATNSPADSY